MSNKKSNQFTDVTYTRFLSMFLQLKSFSDYISVFNISFADAYYDRSKFQRLLRIFKHYQKTHRDLFDFSDLCQDDYDYYQLYRLIIKPHIHEKKENT